jgi:hypothetical protein
MLRKRNLTNPVGLGPVGELPYDRTGVDPGVPTMQGGLQGEAMPPVMPQPMPRPLDAVGDEAVDPNLLMADQMYNAYGVDPELDAVIEEEIRRAALAQLGLA